jgi:hypothetical protein
MADHEALIDALTADAHPVRRLLPAAWRVVIWTALALPLGAVVALAVQPHPTDWSHAGAAWTALELVTALALGVLATAAAFDFAIAGRRFAAWPWLALALAAWVMAVAGRLSVTPEPVGHLGMGGYCYTFMLLAGAPMAVLAVAALRRSRAIHPGRALALAGLGSTFLALTLLTLCHPIEGRLIDELMHLAAGVTLMTATVLLGRPWVKVD